MKKILRVSISTIFLLALITITSCKKDKNSDSSTDKKTLLTSHIWKYNDLSTASTDVNIQVYVGLMKAFMINATVSFTTGGIYTEVTLGDTSTGTWEFNATETSIIIDKGTADENEIIISQLTSDVLEVKENTQDVDLGNFQVTYKWVK